MAQTHGDTLWQVTRSSMLRRVGDAAPGADRDAAWSELIDAYRRPISVCLRRRVGRHPDGEAIIADFFTYLFTEGVIAKLDRAKGRFRVFLQGVMRLYVKAKYREYAPSGGEAGLEQLLIVDPTPSAEVEEERTWARSLFDRAVEQLKQAKPRDGKILLLVLGVGSQPQVSPAEIAASQGLTLNTVHVATSRARKELKRRLLSQIHEMCADEEDFEAEEAVLIGRLLEAAPGLFG